MQKLNRERSVDSQMASLIDAAIADQICVVPQTPSQCVRMSEWARAGRLVRVFPNMYITRPVERQWEGNPRIRAWWLTRTYARRFPDRPLCSFSAAVVHGLWVSHSFLDRLYVVATEGETTHRAPGVFYRKVKDRNVVDIGGVKVTTIEQTVLDCVLAAPFAEGLAIADSALRYRDVTNETLLAYFRKHGKRRPGIKKALLVARYACPDAENGGESIARGLIIAVGYMPPTALQVEFTDPVEPSKTLRVDGFFSLPGNRGVIFELDGMGKYPELWGGDAGPQGKSDDVEAQTGEGSESPQASDTFGFMDAGACELTWDGSESSAIDGEDDDAGLRGALIDERQRESHITALGYPVMRVLFKRIREDGYLVALLRAYGIPQVQEPFPFA